MPAARELAVDTSWDSQYANAVDMPKSWYDFGDGDVRLKDTASAFYKNRLVDPNTFYYELPRGVSDARTRLLEDVPRPLEQRLRVRLFRIAHGHDHDLGEWVIRDGGLDPRPHLLLARVRAPTPPQRRAKRSRSESQHGPVLERIFDGMRLDFEPECASGLRTPCVEDGVAEEWSSDFYTIDYVATDVARGRMVCIESKCERDALDEAALKKCRRLRDVGLRRVVAVAGHGDALGFYDFGTGEADEGWCSADEMRARVAEEILGK